MKEKMQAIGITIDKHLVVVSEDGLTSSLVAALLLEMGFQQVSHVEGGLLALRR